MEDKTLFLTQVPFSIPGYLSNPDASADTLVAFVFRRLLETAPEGISKRNLIDQVMRLLGLVADSRGEVRNCLDELYDSGEIQRLRLSSEDGQLVLALPSTGIVRIRESLMLLLGSETFWQLQFGETKIIRIGCQRYIDSGSIPGLEIALRENAILEIGASEWLRAPEIESPSLVIAHFDTRLDASPILSNQYPMQIIDSAGASRVEFYKGRLITPRRSSNGRFVAQRPEGTWSYVEIDQGKATKIINLDGTYAVSPLAEARLLQAALDKNLGNPQIFRVQYQPSEGTAFLSLYSPPVPWLERALLSLSLRTGNFVPGSLVTYAIPIETVEKASSWCKDYMYLAERKL
jgi:hypothetical protein